MCPTCWLLNFHQGLGLIYSDVVLVGLKKTTTIILSNISFSSAFFSPLWKKKILWVFNYLWQSWMPASEHDLYICQNSHIYLSSLVLKCLADGCTLLWSMKAYTQNYVRVLLTVSLTHSISSLLLWKTISSFVLCGYLGFVSFIFNLLGVAGLLKFVG